MKTYNVCFIIKFLFCLLAFTSIHFFNFSHVYAQTLNSNNQFSLICKTIVTANVGNKGQIYETLYNFNLSPPTVYLNDLNVSYPVKYSENYIEILGGNHALISRLTGTYQADGMQGSCEIASDKKLF